MTDSGVADPRLASALAVYDGSAATRAQALAALAGARVFVPVTATRTSRQPATQISPRPDAGTELALVSMLSSDGERAVPAFLDPAAMRRWRLEARPVPLRAADLCRTALVDGAAAVIVDPVGSALILDRGELAALAAGYLPVGGTPLAARWTTDVLTTPTDRPDASLLAALADAVAPERLRAARLLDGPEGLVLGVVPAKPLDPAALAALALRVMARLGPGLPAAGLDLAVVSASGPGHPVGGCRFG